VEEIVYRVRQAFVESSPLDDYTFPIVALLRGRKVDQRLEQHFGSVEIENLWRPFFCVSANLTTGKPQVHDQGDLVRALRASIAIPGLLPPVITREGVLVDGAVLNNLPTDVMANKQRGFILAVDVARDLALQPHTGHWATKVLRRVGSIAPEAPSIGSVLIRAGTVSSDAQVAMTRRKANMVLQPPLSEIGLRDWRAFDRAVEIGYAHAKVALDDGLFDKTTQ
jgi:NTE family protein